MNFLKSCFILLKNTPFIWVAVYRTFGYGKTITRFLPAVVGKLPGSQGRGIIEKNPQGVVIKPAYFIGGSNQLLEAFCKRWGVFRVGDFNGNE